MVYMFRIVARFWTTIRYIPRLPLNSLVLYTNMHSLFHDDLLVVRMQLYQ